MAIIIFLSYSCWQVTNFNPDLECLVQVIKREDRDILKDSDVDVILCLEEYKTVLQVWWVCSLVGNLVSG